MVTIMGTADSPEEAPARRQWRPTGVSLATRLEADRQGLPCSP